MISKQRFYLMWSIAIIILMVTTGCGLNYVNKSKAEIEDAIKVRYDGFKKITHVTGPNNYMTDGSLFESRKMFMRAWKSDYSEKIFYQIYVVTTDSHWRHQNAAHDSTGNKLDVTVISNDIRCGQLGCVLSEHIGVSISESYLHNHRVIGIKFQVSGSGGDAVIDVPPAYIEAFLNKIGSVFKTK